MSATVDNQTDWTAEAVRLRTVEKMATAEIAERVGRSASQVRKVIASANTAHAMRDPEPEAIRADIERAASEEGEKVWRDVGMSVIPGQTTVDDHLAPEDDPEFTAAALDDFRAEAGEPVGPMPKREMDGGDVVPETRLAGTRQLALDFGPNADTPVGGTLVIRSDKLASGFYGLGDLIHGTFTARVVDVGGKERLQRASDEFRAQPQTHVALITELTVGSGS